MDQHSARETIREIANNTENVQFPPHAIQRMQERDISDLEVIRCLRAGFIEEGPIENLNGDWECKVTATISGRFISAPIVITIIKGTEVIIVKTAF